MGVGAIGVALVFMVSSAFEPLGQYAQRLPHTRCPAIRRLGIQRCVPTLGAAVKGVVARHQHIASGGDDLAPVAGRAVVLAWGWGDGHGLFQFKILNGQPLCFQFFRIQGGCQLQHMGLGCAGE